MKDIGARPWAAKTIEDAQGLISTLKNSHWVTGKLREQNSLVLLKPAGTRFGTNYIALERLLKVREVLDRLVTTKGWEEHAAKKEAATKEKFKGVKTSVRDDNFWKGVEQVLKVLKPVYVLLREIDGNQELEKIFGVDKECSRIFRRFIREYYDGEVVVDEDGDSKPMATVIEEELMIYLQGVGEIGDKKAREDHELIKKGKQDPVHWWKFNGCDCPNLSKLACRVLKQCVSASTCETNWSVWESVHTVRRNRLGPRRLADLVYVTHNYNTVRKLHAEQAKNRMVAGTTVGRVEEEEKDDTYEPLDDEELEDCCYEESKDDV
ncbi:unnamed protein product [Closterium sp. NIES-65]|nr:unnamed protein product [Closterium sp. NIES-65]